MSLRCVFMAAQACCIMVVEGEELVLAVLYVLAPLSFSDAQDVVRSA